MIGFCFGLGHRLDGREYCVAGCCYETGERGVCMLSEHCGNRYELMTYENGAVNTGNE